MRPIIGTAGSTSVSSVFVSVAATPRTLWRRSASTIRAVPRASPVQPFGTRPYTSAVDSGKLGFTRTIASPPLLVSARNRSPRPVPTARPRPRKNGTPLPIRAPSSASRSRDHLRPQTRFNAQSVAAASLDPPPSPAATGIRLSSRMWAPSSLFAASWRSRAARITRLPSPVGNAGSVLSSEIVSALFTVNRSKRSTAWSTVAISW
jgi:hypothetical protein